MSKPCIHATQGAPRPWRVFRNSRRLGAGVLALAGLASCQVESPGVSREAATLTGLEDVIVFREVADLSKSTTLPHAEGLSVAAAVRMALLHDPRVQVALAKVRSAEADALQARLLPNPILNVDVRFAAQPGAVTAFESTLSADLLSLLQKPGLKAAADKRLRASACEALVVVLDLIEEVQESYAAAASNDAEVRNAEGRLEILRRVRSLAEERVAAGEGTRLDVLTVDAQTAQAELDLSDLRELGRQEELHLARLIGRPMARGEWRFTMPTPQSDSVQPEEEWVAIALERRPEVGAKRWELGALGDDLAAASYAPLAGGDMGLHSEHDSEWRIGPTITIPLPIFDWGQASRAKFTAQRIAARHDLVRQQEEIIQEVRSAHASCVHAQESLLAVQDRLLPLQREQLDLAQRTYRAGESDLTTLLLAESELQTSLSKCIELQEKLFVATLKLQRAAGGTAVAAPLMNPATTSSTRPDVPTSRPATGALP